MERKSKINSLDGKENFNHKESRYHNPKRLENENRFSPDIEAEGLKQEALELTQSINPYRGSLFFLYYE